MMSALSSSAGFSALMQSVALHGKQAVRMRPVGAEAAHGGLSLILELLETAGGVCRLQRHEGKGEFMPAALLPRGQPVAVIYPVKAAQQRHKQRPLPAARLIKAVLPHKGEPAPVCAAGKNNAVHILFRRIRLYPGGGGGI